MPLLSQLHFPTVDCFRYMIGHNLLLSLRLDSIIIWILLSFLPSKSYSYGIEFDFDTSILTYEYKYHFHLLNQMYGTEVNFDTCILFLMLIRIVRSGPYMEFSIIDFFFLNPSLNNYKLMT